VVDPDGGKTKYASAHDLRRSFGFRWSEHVMPAQLKELMGHESISTTMKYYVGRNAENTATALYKAVGRRLESLPNGDTLTISEAGNVKRPT
jgi:integrase